MSDFPGLADAWMEAVWTASWQGGLALLIAMALGHRLLNLPPRIVCWVWRLAYCKLLVALFWTAPIEIALLEPESAAVPSTLARVADPVTAERAGGKQAVGELVGEAPPDVAAELPVSPAEAAFVAWLLGSAILAGFTASQAWRAHRLRTAAGPASARLQALLAEEAARFDFRAPRLAVGSSVEAPLLVGVWRPCIVLPARVEANFAEAEIRLMLAHELAHLERRDLVWNWLPALARALFFFHPLVWWAARPWREAQELACDERVVAAGIAPAQAYGRLVLRLCTDTAAAGNLTFSTAG